MEKVKVAKQYKKKDTILGLIIICAIVLFAFKACSDKPNGTQKLDKAIEVFEKGTFKSYEISADISFVLSSKLSVDSAIASYHEDITKFLNRIYKSKELDSLEEIHFIGYSSFVDKYGNSKEEVALRGKLKVSDIKKINFDNFNYRMLENIIELTYKHPGMK